MSELLAAALVLAPTLLLMPEAHAAICRVSTRANPTNYPTIQFAVNTPTCTTVMIPSGVFKEHDIAINRNLSIDGNSQTNSIIDGEKLGTVFVVNSGTVTLKGLSIQKGMNTQTPLTRGGLSGALGYNSSGGVYNKGTLTIQNCNILANMAKDYLDDNSPFGAGILNLGKLLIKNILISGNFSEFGGAGITNWQGTLTLQNSVVSGNKANISSGGIYNYDGKTTLDNSIVSGNYASAAGGMTNANSNGVSTIKNSSLISGNVATKVGGGIVNYNGGSSVISPSSHVVNNSPDDIFDIN